MWRWPLRAPTPLKSTLWPIIDPTLLLVTGQICNFRDPNLITLFLCIYLISPLNRSQKNELTLFLQYKHSGTFANRKYEDLSYPKNQKMCDPILVSVLKMRPHYSQSSRENSTPSSGTSPLAYYKEVPLPGEVDGPIDWGLKSGSLRFFPKRKLVCDPYLKTTEFKSRLFSIAARKAK